MNMGRNELSFAVLSEPQSADGVIDVTVLRTSMSLVPEAASTEVAFGASIRFRRTRALRNATIWSSTLAAALVLVTGLACRAEASELTILHHFAGEPGDLARPRGALTLVDGRLFGGTEGTLTSTHTNPPGDGVFGIDLDGTDYEVHHFFTPPGGRIVHNNLVSIGGLLLGTTSGSGTTGVNGAIFSMKPDGSEFTPLRTFSTSSGRAPSGSLVATDDRVYGTTYSGGASDVGVLYSIRADGADYQVHKHFMSDALDVGQPRGLSLFNNRLYGVADLGRDSEPQISGLGAVYAVDLDGSNFEVLHIFNEALDGKWPKSPPTFIGERMYGTAQYGGLDDRGIIYSMQLDGSDYQVLHNFLIGDAAIYPETLLAVGDTLYGTSTLQGDAIFSIQADGSGFQVLHTFVGGPDDGSAPFGGLLHVDGKLYGTTLVGGKNDLGVIYMIPVPEPPTLALAAIGMMGLAIWHWRRCSTPTLQ